MTDKDLQTGITTAQVVTWQAVKANKHLLNRIPQEDILAECYLWVSENPQHLSKGVKYITTSMNNHLKAVYKKSSEFYKFETTVDGTLMDVSANTIRELVDNRKFYLSRQEIIKLIRFHLNHKVEYGRITQKEWKPMRWAHKKQILESFESSWNSLQKTQRQFLIENFNDRGTLEQAKRNRLNRYIKYLQEWTAVDLGPIAKKVNNTEG